MTIERKNKPAIFPKVGKISMVVFALLFAITGYRAYQLFGYVFKPVVLQTTVFYIASDSDYEDVEHAIVDQEIIEDARAFRWVAKKKKYMFGIKPGKYQLKAGWNANELVNILRIGQQVPVEVTFNNARTLEALAGKVSKYFEADSTAFLEVIADEKTMEKYGFDANTYRCMFLPNTYEMYWNNTPEEFVKRMSVEYQQFWSNNKKQQANKHQLTPIEVSILASIVQEETIKEEEKAKVAGLYVNRLKKGMLLQADPTVKFAMGDVTIRRVTNDMLKVDSPYNTYKYKGLPPGPINIPEITSIEAVLNAERHNYLYMCAKEDFSGYHNFARTNVEHNRNAAKYRRALNKNKIWR